MMALINSGRILRRKVLGIWIVLILMFYIGTILLNPWNSSISENDVPKIDKIVNTSLIISTTTILISQPTPQPVKIDSIAQEQKSEKKASAPKPHQKLALGLNKNITSAQELTKNVSNSKMDLNSLFWHLIKNNGSKGNYINSLDENSINLISQNIKKLPLWTSKRLNESLNLSMVNHFDPFGLGPEPDSVILAQHLWGMIAGKINPNLLKPHKTKRIAALSWWDYDEGHRNGLVSCPGSSVDKRCEIMQGIQDGPVDAYVLGQVDTIPDVNENTTVRIFVTLESPYHSASFTLNGPTDLLASYWRGSDIRTPYSQWAYYDPLVRRMDQSRNYASGKTSMAVMVVSNCHGGNDRLGYVLELQKYMEVDVYGNCGKGRCRDEANGTCFQRIGREYKFYLAFENTNCRDYISEKFYMNGLRNGMLPVVLGAHPDDYKAGAPENSYIHIEDYNSPKELAAYLLKLADDDEAYNKYFEWIGTGDFISCDLLCSVCTMLFQAEENSHRKHFGELSWGPYENLKFPMCLPMGRWYWTRPNHPNPK